MGYKRNILQQLNYFDKYISMYLAYFIILCILFLHLKTFSEKGCTGFTRSPESLRTLLLRLKQLALGAVRV